MKTLEQFIVECQSDFNALEDAFIAHGKKIASAEGFYDNEATQNAMEEAFLGILSSQKRQDEIKENIQKYFNNDVKLAKLVVTAAFLFLLRDFAAKTSPLKLGENLEFLISQMTNFYPQEKEVEKEEEKEILTNTISFDNGEIQLFGDIFAELENAKKSGAKVSMLNLYKGVNIKSTATITEIVDNKIHITCDLMQMLAMREEGSAFILKDERISSDIEGKISNFDFAKREVILKDFRRSTKTKAVLRAFPRVQPDKITPVRLTSTLNSDESVNGKLFDLSQGGIGVVSNEGLPWQSGEELKAIFLLDIGGITKQVVLNLKLLIALNYGGTMRYCCQILDASESAKADIVAFAKEREKNTIEELKHTAENFI